METLKLEIAGMHCGGCVAALKKAFNAVAGVKSTDVSLNTQSALVTFDPHLSNVSQLTKAVVGAGYAVRSPGAAKKAAPAGGCGAAGGKTGCGCG